MTCQQLHSFAFESRHAELFGSNLYPTELISQGILTRYLLRQVSARALFAPVNYLISPVAFMHLPLKALATGYPVSRTRDGNCLLIRSARLIQGCFASSNHAHGATMIPAWSVTPGSKFQIPIRFCIGSAGTLRDMQEGH